MKLRKQTKQLSAGFTLVELLVVLTVIGVLAAMLAPALTRAKGQARQTGCISNLRQVSLATMLYMADHNGELFRHHEGWVLDDGTQVDTLPGTPDSCVGGGMGTSHAEKPWVIFLQPYLQSRSIAFCPSDPTPRSRFLARDLRSYNGEITSTTENPPRDSELARARSEGLNMQSYLLNSIFTHRSARYAVEGVLHGFATEKVISALLTSKLIMFSERNSEAMNAPDNLQFGNIGQDDYDTWVGEGALVRWGEGPYAEQGWLRHDRHRRRANYIYTDGHVANLRWKQARKDQFPDGVVRRPLLEPLE